jgi:hypothetical protein
MIQNDPQNIGSGPHDPDPPPPPPKAILDAIAAGAEWQDGALVTPEGPRFLHLLRSDTSTRWQLSSSMQGTYRLELETFVALKIAARTGEPWSLFGQRVALMPRFVGRLTAVLEVVGGEAAASADSADGGA